MATAGTPFEGRDNIIGPAVYTGLQLILYTNTQDSLDSSTVLADLTEPSGTGYAAIPLNGTWVFNNGVVTYNIGGANPTFTNSGGSSWTGNCTGSAITDGTYVLHFKDFASDPVEVVAGGSIEIDISTLVG